MRRTDWSARWSRRPRPAALLTTTTAAALALALAVSGCGSSTVGGIVSISGDEVDGEAVPFEGELLIGPQSCELVRLTTPPGSTTDRWVVWPRGAELYTGGGGDAGSAAARQGAVVDGEAFLNGDRIRGAGYVVGLEALPGEGRRSGGMYAERGRYCDADRRGVLVIAAVERA